MNDDVKKVAYDLALFANVSVEEATEAISKAIEHDAKFIKICLDELSKFCKKSENNP